MSLAQIFVYYFERTFKFYLGFEPADSCPIQWHSFGTPFSDPYSPPLLVTNGPMIACFDEVSGEWQIKEYNF